MNEHIHNLLAQLEAVENDLNKALQESQVHLNFSIKGKRVEFEKSVKDVHKSLRVGIIKWLGMADCLQYGFPHAITRCLYQFLSSNLFPNIQNRQGKAR